MSHARHTSSLCESDFLNRLSDAVDSQSLQLMDRLAAVHRKLINLREPIAQDRVLAEHSLTSFDSAVADIDEILHSCGAASEQVQVFCYNRMHQEGSEAKNGSEVEHRTLARIKRAMTGRDLPEDLASHVRLLAEELRVSLEDLEAHVTITIAPLRLWPRESNHYAPSALQVRGSVTHNQTGETTSYWEFTKNGRYHSPTAAGYTTDLRELEGASK